MNHFDFQIATKQENMKHEIYTTNLSTFHMAYVDALVLVQGEGLALRDHLHLYGGYIFQWASDHPAVPRLPVIFLHRKRQIFNNCITI